MMMRVENWFAPFGPDSDSTVTLVLGRVNIYTVVDTF